MLNLIKVIMLLNIGGFVILVLWIDYILIQSSIEKEIRNKVGGRILSLGIIVQLLLTMILIRYGN